MYSFYIDVNEAIYNVAYVIIIAYSTKYRDS